MTRRSNRLMFAIAFTVGAAVAGAARADAIITTFDNFTLGTYAAWSDPNLTTLTSNATHYRIESVGFGGGFHDVFPAANGSAEDTIQFDVTVHAGDSPNVLAVLEDGDGTQWAYRWYVLPSGNHVLTQPLSPVPGGGFNGISYDSFVSQPGSTPGFDFSSVPFFHIQVDAHGSNVPYDISFNDLRLTTGVIPEPGSLAMLTSGALALIATAWRRCR